MKNDIALRADIRSETGALGSVIIHSPGEEHGMMLPYHTHEWIGSKSPRKNPDYLLFDDIIYTQIAQRQHACLREVLDKFTQGNCYEVADMLRSIMADTNTRESIIHDSIELENRLFNRKIDSERLLDLPPDALLKTLLSGSIRKDNTATKIFSHPLPNLIFTRDIAAVIGKTVLLTRSNKNVRRRENVLTEHLFSYHSLLKDNTIYNFSRKNPDNSIEGGDITIYDTDTICIGISERTSRESIELTLPIIFDEGFRNVIAIDMPKDRSVMHLDTIFTRLGESDALVYPPIIAKPSYTQRKYLFNSDGTMTESTALLQDILSDISGRINMIECGGDDPTNQEREQWTDGANAFALSPTLSVGYDINTYTLRQIAESGYNIVTHSEYLDSSFQNKGRSFITIPGSELSRGRGGARCLTLPIMRQ